VLLLVSRATLNHPEFIPQVFSILFNRRLFLGIATGIAKLDRENVIGN